MPATKKNKKKRRKLKKSVRMGCIGFVLGFVAIVSLAVAFCTGGDETVARETVAADTAYVFRDTTFANPQMADRLKRLVDTPMRIDTSHLGICVYDLTEQALVYAHRDCVPMPPASCMKLLPAIASLHLLGCGHYYESALLTDGTVSRGTLTGTLVVAMDDDPLIDSFAPLTDALRRRGVQAIEGDIVFDLARRDTLRQHVTAMPWDIPYGSVPLLMKGEARVRREFMQSLAASGVAFRRNALVAHPALQGVDEESNPAAFRLAVNRIYASRHMATLACVRHDLREVLAPMLIFSSNTKAECVFFHTAHVLSRWGGRTAVPSQVMMDFVHRELEGADTSGLVVLDGSGLSPENRLTARFLTQLLTWAWTQKDIRRVLMDEALASPACSRRGSLMGRMQDARFHGKVFCKTGTLTMRGVSSLSGYCQGRDGHWYAFAIMNEEVAVGDARVFQDRVCGTMVK